MAADVGTTQNLFLNNTNSTLPTLAKLNIMSTDNVPQLMFAQTTSTQDNENRTWNGDNVTFNYVENTFSVSSHKIINFELLGTNNVYLEKNNDNLLIQSHNNLFLEEKQDQNTYIHASNIRVFNYNNEANALIRCSFIGANGADIYLSGTGAAFTNNSLYNSYDNYFDINTNENYALNNQVLINCNCNFYKNFNSTYNDTTKHSTYINSNTSYYNFNIDSKDNTIIGNKYGFIEGNSGNVIAIGQGIVLSGKKTDKIILGYYNSNTMDEDDLLVVGDGFLNETNTTLIPSGNWYDNEDEMRIVLGDISGDKTYSENNNEYYRHNIFTVNKNGYITISDYTKPSNSARYGYDGISAYIEGEEYKIKFKELYKSIVPDSTINFMENETIDSYIEKIDDKLKYIPTIFSLDINTDISNLSDKFQTELEDNTLVTITNTDIASNEHNVTAYFRINGESYTQDHVKRIHYGGSIQFLYRKPNINLPTWTFSGFTLVE